jgi:nitroreductase/NAD-dependent dihydropyrimidine dehydrogenase PreA subunit
METLANLAFSADPELCNRCGRCVTDCIAGILTLPDEGSVQLNSEKAGQCYQCQHCMAICPHGAISILGRDPRESLPLAGNLPSAQSMEVLLRGRRSTRVYKPGNIPSEQIREMLDIADAAPTARNCRGGRWTVIDERSKLEVFRDKLLAGIEDAAARGTISGENARFAAFPRAWKEEHNDILFRGAPHCVVVSAPRNEAAPQVDCVIALSYFELLAHTRGVATLWDGLAYRAIVELVPEARQWLGIPEDHLIGYCMAFGLPKSPFQRTVQHTPPEVNWVR